MSSGNPDAVPLRGGDDLGLRRARAERACHVPGLRFLGRKWLVRRDSGIMLGMGIGMGKDAVLVANGVREHLAS
jgi:hypothetical protein